MISLRETPLSTFYCDNVISFLVSWRKSLSLLEMRSQGAFSVGIYLLSDCPASLLLLELRALRHGQPKPRRNVWEVNFLQKQYFLVSSTGRNHTILSIISARALVLNQLKIPMGKRTRPSLCQVTTDLHTRPNLSATQELYHRIYCLRGSP